MNMMRSMSTFLAVAVLELSTLAGYVRSASAQAGDEASRDRARTFLVVRIADALKLSDADALKVSAVIRQSDLHRQELVRQRAALEEKLRAALQQSPADGTRLNALVGEGNALDQQIALVPEDTFRELQKTLTLEQQAKLLLFRRELQAEVRRALRQPPTTRRSSPTGGGSK
jgi:hypothetical protein